MSTFISASLTIVQQEFTRLQNAVPMADASKVQGWQLKIDACSGSDVVLWSGTQGNDAQQQGGRICLSPLIVQVLFLELANSSLDPDGLSVQNVVRLLLKYDSTAPLLYDGNSANLIQSWVSKQQYPRQFTPADIQALEGAIDGTVGELGGTVMRKFTAAVDYMLARQLVKI